MYYLLKTMPHKSTKKLLDPVDYKLVFFAVFSYERPALIRLDGTKFDSQKKFMTTKTKTIRRENQNP